VDARSVKVLVSDGLYFFGVFAMVVLFVEYHV